MTNQCGRYLATSEGNGETCEPAWTSSPPNASTVQGALPEDPGQSAAMFSRGGQHRGGGRETQLGP